MLHTIKNSYLQVTASEQGAELQSIKDSAGVEYLWQGDAAYWKSRATNLFPYVGRLVDGKYLLDGNTYHMGSHGFARHCRFKLAQIDSQHMVLELTENDELLSQYPRRFIFRVSYTLSDHTLQITYHVQNCDVKAMRFGLGGHPGFNIPFVGGEFEDYRIRFAEKCHPKQILFSSTVHVTGQTDYTLQDDQYIPLQHGLFFEDAIVLKNMAREVTLESTKADRSITVSFPGMPYLGIWHTPNTDAPFVCVEPWCTLPAAYGKPTVFEEQDDLLVLAPGESYKNTWTVSIR